MSHPPIQDYHPSVQQEPEDDEFHNGPDRAARVRPRDGASVSETTRGAGPLQEQRCYTGLSEVLSSLPILDGGPAQAFRPQRNGHRNAAVHG
jgi:hypothetical protein